MLTLLRLAAANKTEYDVFRNKNNNFCCLEHDFGSPMIQDASIDDACDWLLRSGVQAKKEELTALLSKLVLN